MPKGKMWTQEEVTFLKENHGIMTHRELAKKFGRTKHAVEVKKRYMRKNHKQKEIGLITWRKIYSMYKHNAPLRNLSFLLTFEEFKSICSNICAYCGAKPNKRNAYLKLDGTFFSGRKISAEHVARAWIESNGIDRLDNDKGYELDNCVPCCTRCNFIKNSMHCKEFLEWITKVNNHTSKTGLILKFTPEKPI